MAGSLPEIPGQPSPRHFLRQLGPLNAETLGLHQTRLATNRGNGYNLPEGLTGFQSASTGMFPNFDCKNLDYGPEGGDPDEDEVEHGETPPPDVNDGEPPDPSFAACTVTRGYPDAFGAERGPQVTAEP
jgi:hypothetical protein